MGSLDPYSTGGAPHGQHLGLTGTGPWGLRGHSVQQVGTEHALLQFVPSHLSQNICNVTYPAVFLSEFKYYHNAEKCGCRHPVHLFCLNLSLCFSTGRRVTELFTVMRAWGSLWFVVMMRGCRV